jgi:hypothetical protein
LSKVGVAKQPLAQGAESMSKITQNTLHDKMPISQLHDSVCTFVEPVTTLLPDISSVTQGANRRGKVTMGEMKK